MNLDPNLQLRLRERPAGPSLMRHKWRDLTFLHYSVDPEVIQKLIPPQLTVDTFGGRAWVGLVPFWMTGVRLSFLPPIPGTHTFPETNVRTYVHRNGKDPGVWFFSLDAANSLAVWGARKFFGLPYFRADMELEHNAGLRYESRRRRSSAGHDIQVQVGGVIPDPEPGSLEFFLVERYLLYSQHRDRIVTGMVHHEPYSLFQASIERCDETLLEASGLSAQPWEHACYSPGVDVEVFEVRR
jgi:uncharacterized protein YqjF (DUF2071 family)